MRTGREQNRLASVTRKENAMKATKRIAIGLVLVLGMNCVAKASETGCRKADDISAGEYHTMVLMPDGRGRGTGISAG